MKNSTKRQNVRLSQSSMKQNKIYNSELFWVSHSSILVSSWMKYDWFKLNRGEFLSKWIMDAMTTKLETRRNIILSVLKPIWLDIDSAFKYEVFTLICQGKHYTDSFHMLWELQELFECNFIKATMNEVYEIAVNRNLDTNYFAAYGILVGKEN